MPHGHDTAPDGVNPPGQSGPDLPTERPHGDAALDDPGHPDDGPGHPDDNPSWPDGIDPLGVPTSQSEREAFVLALAAVISLLGLCVTLGWIVFNQMQTGG